MSSPHITIKITKDTDDQIKTTVDNQGGNDEALQMMSAVLKLFLNDQDALLTYAHLVRTYIESANKKEDTDGE